MKAIIDSKANLARGFADVTTPSHAENELVFSWKEKQEHIKSQIAELSSQLELANDKKTRNILSAEIYKKTQSLSVLGRKINKRIDVKMLLIDRLQEMVSEENFQLACYLAKEDRDRILKAIPLTDEDLEQMTTA